jgi:CRISPR-associated protein Csb2
MALVAAHFETGADPSEREALLWMETLPPPLLKASTALERAVVTHYVPVNDKAGEVSKPPTAIIQSAPQLARDRQPRSFARAWLEGEVAYMVWPDAEPPEPVARALEGLAAKVTRVGHSMSLVQAWLAAAGEIGGVDWIPDDARAELQLRVVRPGTLAELERRYNGPATDAWASLVLAAEENSDKKAQRAARKRLNEEFGGESPCRLRPQIAFYQGYARPDERGRAMEASPSIFSPHLVVFALERRSGPYVRLGLRSVALVTQRWREALVSQANDMPDSVQAVVSGHASDGAPLQRPHLAFAPMAFVGDTYADGHLLGVAAALPRELAGEDRRLVLRVLGRVSELRLGPLGAWALVRELGDRPTWNLHDEAWTAHPDGATHWATVTPVAFDRHPKARDRGEYQRNVAAMIGDACLAVGLPRPREVVVTSVSAHLGVPPAFEFPRLARKDGSERRHAHAIVVFDEPVVGPLLIGAGRYRGYGACRPIE